jgi:hypothetical protein
MFDNKITTIIFIDFHYLLLLLLLIFTLGVTWDPTQTSNRCIPQKSKAYDPYAALYGSYASYLETRTKRIATDLIDSSHICLLLID